MAKHILKMKLKKLIYQITLIPLLITPCLSNNTILAETNNQNVIDIIEKSSEAMSDVKSFDITTDFSIETSDDLSPFKQIVGRLVGPVLKEPVGLDLKLETLIETQDDSTETTVQWKWLDGLMYLNFLGTEQLFKVPTENMSTNESIFEINQTEIDWYQLADWFTLKPTTNETPYFEIGLTEPLAPSDFVAMLDIILPKTLLEQEMAKQELIDKSKQQDTIELLYDPNTYELLATHDVSVSLFFDKENYKTIAYLIEITPKTSEQESYINATLHIKLGNYNNASIEPWTKEQLELPQIELFEGE